MALFALAASACGPQVSTASSVSPSAVASPPQSPSGTPGAIAYIQPSSASFVDAQRGWVIGRACDAQGTCRPGVARTNDGGAFWVQLGSPPQRPMPAGQDPWPNGASIRFTSSAEGWVFNPFLAHTLDGGQTWQMVSLPTGGPVTDVVAFGGSIWAVISCSSERPCLAKLWQSPPAAAQFQLAASQPPNLANAIDPYFEAILAGPRLILVSPFADAGPAFAVTVDGRSWHEISSPCSGSRQQLGSSPGGILMDVCWAAVGGGWGPKAAWSSSDGGGHWSLRSRSADLGTNMTPVGTITEHGYPNEIAMPTTLDAWMSMGRNDLYETHDGGITWSASTVPGQFGGDAGGAEHVLFADTQHGWALGSGGLYRTTDGRHWSRSDILGPVPGYP